MKLELASSIGYPNYFQISIISSKFRASIPFLTSEGTTMQFELMKLSGMMLVYFLHQGYHWRQRRDRKIRERMLREQQNRFTEQRSDLQRQTGYIEIAAASKVERENRYKGLVVVKAILGEKHKINNARKKVGGLKLNKIKNAKI